MQRALTRRAPWIIASNGFAILGLEFAAARQLAPIFGQSMFVWSAIIAVVLIAIALGYALGGRWGQARIAPRRVATAHAVAALLVACVAWWGPAWGHALLRPGLPQGHVPVGLWGSLVHAALCYGLPTVLLATTTPYLLAQSPNTHALHRRSGLWLALGTLGSLLACWCVPVELLQRLGTRTTLLCIAGLVVGQALLLATLPRWRVGQSKPLASKQAKPASLPPRVWAAAVVTGLAVTLLEFAGVRLFASWTGQSNYVWAGMLSCCMLALALGAWVGGRVAAARPPRSALAACCAGAALLSLIAAWGAPTLLSAWVPPQLTSVTLLPAALPASLAASLLLLGVPLLLLGMCTPLLIAWVEQDDGRAGRRLGRVLAANTVGGLVGCLATAPLFVPWLGSRGTVLLAALALGAVAYSLAKRPDKGHALRHGIALGALGAAALLIGLFSGPLRTHAGQVLERESAYQTIRVAEEALPCIDGHEGTPALGRGVQQVPTRFLRHDEDAQTYQSVLLLKDRDTLLTGGRYYESLALGAHLVDLAGRDTLDVLIVGHAGGTVWRTLRAHPPKGVRARALSVEIDPAVVEVAREALDHLELEDEHLTLILGEDARTVVNVLPKERTFDLVLVDAYTRTNYVPFQVATVEFFERLRAHLRPGGWVGINVLGTGPQSRVARAVAATATQALGPTYMVPNPYFPGNVTLWTGPDTGLGPRVRAASTLPGALENAAFALERLAVRINPRPGDPILTDDHAPSDRLADTELGVGP